MTIKELINSQDLTPLETEIVEFMGKELEGNFGEGYSHLGVIDIAKGMKIPGSRIKGAVGSLVRKKVLTTYPTSMGLYVIAFRNQEDLEPESVLDELVEEFFEDKLETLEAATKAYEAAEANLGQAEAICKEAKEEAKKAREAALKAFQAVREG